MLLEGQQVVLVITLKTYVAGHQAGRNRGLQEQKCVLIVIIGTAWMTFVENCAFIYFIIYIVCDVRRSWFIAYIFGRHDDDYDDVCVWTLSEVVMMEAVMWTDGQTKGRQLSLRHQERQKPVGIGNVTVVFI